MINLKKPINENYACSLVKIKNIIPIENCDNVIHTNVYGNLIIISKDVKIGDLMFYFPVETKIAYDTLSINNLFSNSYMNMKKSEKGYFGKNGRVKAVKFRGNESNGFLLPLDGLSYLNNNKCIDEDFINQGFIYIGDTKIFIDDSFDEINEYKICEKYIPLGNNSDNDGSITNKKSKLDRKLEKTEILEGQFHFHPDTIQLGKNIHKIEPLDLIQITSKYHGTSSISANILCKRKLSFFEKVISKLGVKVQDAEYKNIYSSRKVIKNLSKSKNSHYYTEDIWKKANDRLIENIGGKIPEGLSFYYEIVGYVNENKFIQKNYDYGCNKGDFNYYIYRITYTNAEGNVFEFSAKQVQDYCLQFDIKAVPELYYGYAIDLFPDVEGEDNWNELFLQKLKERFLEKECKLCKNKVPDEGIVLRLEKNTLEVYKLKSYKFLLHETKQLDSGEISIEDE